MSYASGTSVSVEKSRAEIETILARFGCNGFSYRSMPTSATIEFLARDRWVRFTLTIPDRSKFSRRKCRSGFVACKPEEQYKLWEQACREKWRALTLAVKAKLAAVEAGISAFEQEFMAYIVDPVKNQTMAEIILPQIEQRYKGVAGALLGLPAPEETKGGE